MKRTLIRPARTKPDRCPTCRGEVAPAIVGNRKEWGCFRCLQIVESPSGDDTDPPPEAA